jgi:hypothetical protein
MAKQTMQARIRSLGGGPKSAIDARNHLPTPTLAFVLGGVIQFQLSAVASQTLELGMLPAYFALEKVAVMLPAGAGTYTLRLPAYGGLGAVTVVAATASGTSTADATLACPKYSNWSKPRPIELVGAGLTGAFHIGIWGVPLDDARTT